MNETYSLPSDWMIIARKDWNRIHRMLEYDDAEASAVFLQQALEKYLKAFLLQHGCSRGFKMKLISDNSAGKRIIEKPQINTDKRRFINSKAYRNGTRMTRIGRIFTDNSNPCASASSVQSVFNSKIVNRISAFICVHLRLNKLKPAYNGYSEKWSEINS